MISERTKAGLKAAKPRGVQLGNPNIAEAQAAAAASTRANADAFAATVLPIIRQARAAGAKSLRAIAQVLNDRAVRTARAGRWVATQVWDILNRAPDMPTKKPVGRQNGA